jgi:hypothetical protein
LGSSGSGVCDDVGLAVTAAVGEAVGVVVGEIRASDGTGVNILLLEADETTTAKQNNRLVRA